MKIVAVILVLAVQLFLSGCATTRSLNRTAVTKAPLPATEKVAQALKHTHGVTSVQVVHVPSHSCIALAYGPMKTSPYDKFLVSSSDALVLLTIGGEQGYVISFSTLWQNHQPTESERQAAATLMDAISDALAVRFPDFPAKTDFSESCAGLTQPSAPAGSGR